jgi:hypothetical protein
MEGFGWHGQLLKGKYIEGYLHGPVLRPVRHSLAVPAKAFSDGWGDVGSSQSKVEPPFLRTTI